MNRTQATAAFLLVVASGCIGAAEEAQPAAPQIEGHGAVTAFPDAAEQPRDGSRIVVDLTSDGPRDEINPGVEKLSRFVNIYAAAGKSPARVKIVAVLHGEATQTALGDDAYAAAFDTASNPNLPLLRKLRRAGVELLVCGQALTKKGFKPSQTTDVVVVAVSGLTAIVNRQEDGYAYIPLR